MEFWVVNWRTLCLGVLFVAMIAAALWLGQKPHYAVWVGAVIGINVGLIISRVLLTMNGGALPGMGQAGNGQIGASHGAMTQASAAAAEVARLRALVESAYEEGWKAAMARQLAGPADGQPPDWHHSRARDALRT